MFEESGFFSYNYLTNNEPVKFYFFIIFRLMAGAAIVIDATIPEKKHPIRYQIHESVDKLNYE